MKTEIKTFAENESLEKRVLVIGLGGSAFERPYRGSESELSLEQVLDTLKRDGIYRCSFGKIDYLDTDRKNSANITLDDIEALAQIIVNNREYYEGVVIISGTHTLPYIASSLAFMLGDEKMPIIFTGASLSAQHARTDFRRNFSNALDVVKYGPHTISGVTVAFGDKLIYGTNVVNIGTDTRNPFFAPKAPEIGKFGYGAFVPFESWSPIHWPSDAVLRKGELLYHLDRNVVHYPIKSDTDPNHFYNLVNDPKVSGIVLETFGAGNIPSVYLPGIKRAVFEFGKPVAVITTCTHGSADMGLYGVGNEALQAGAISLGNTTKEAALPKLMFALGLVNSYRSLGISIRMDGTRKILHTNYAGETSERFCENVKNSAGYTEVYTQTLSHVALPLIAEDKDLFDDIPIQTYCYVPQQPRVLIIATGGTAAEEECSDGIVRPSAKSFSDLLDVLPGLKFLANIDYMPLMNEESSQLRHHPHRVPIAKAVQRHRKDYDIIVVTHGTDTMAEAAADLSFMLENLDIPLILTGSQRAGFDHSYTDLSENIAAAIEVGLHPSTGRGVKVVFGQHIIDGPTAVKVDEYGISAFRAAGNYRSAGSIGTSIRPFKRNQYSIDGAFNVFTEYDHNVVYHEVNPFPSNVKQFERYVNAADVSGILIGAYDLGELSLEMVAHIHTAVKNGKIIAYVSTPEYGSADLSTEGIPGEIIKAGAIALGPMTTDAAFQKLRYALGKANYAGLTDKAKLGAVIDILYTNLAGEIDSEFCIQARKIYARFKGV
ncbi:MAG: asparaginase domain-containing protein [Candidatus Woesearchaeota archaeon]|jgi:L-asparaginase